MTTLGHMLFGASIAVMSMPEFRLRRSDAVYLFLVILAANLPDLPLPWWGHHKYHISHSVFTNGAILMLFLISGEGLARLRRTTLGWRLPCAVFLAGMSHMVLDSFYNHGRGLRVLWPFDTFRLALPLPWFTPPDLSHSFWNGYNLSIIGIEWFFFTPLLLMVIIFRKWRRNGASIPAECAEEGGR